MTSRPFDADAMAREIAIELDRRGFGFDEEIKAYAAALQRQHDAHEAEVRGLRTALEEIRPFVDPKAWPAALKEQADD